MRLFRRRPDEAPPAHRPPWQRNPLVGPDPELDVSVPVTNPELTAAVNQWLADTEDVEARKTMS